MDASAAIGHYFTIYVDWGTTGLRYLWIGFFVVLTKVYILAVCIMMSVMIGSQIFMYSHIFCIAVSKMLQDRKFVAPVEAKRKIQMWWKPAKVLLLIVGKNTVTMTPVGKYKSSHINESCSELVDYASASLRILWHAYIRVSTFLTYLLFLDCRTKCMQLRSPKVAVAQYRIICFVLR